MDERGFDYMNVIPLVDVMLVLLTIVLTTSTFIASGAIPVQLPKAGSASDASMKSVTVEIAPDGTIHMDAEPVSLSALRTKLMGLDRELPLMIRADRTIELQVFVDVLDTARILGFSKIGLQTERTQ